MNIVGAMDLLGECVKPLLIELPDGHGEVLVRRILGDDGMVKAIVDVRPSPERSWVPIELCGGRFKVRDE